MLKKIIPSICYALALLGLVASCEPDDNGNNGPAPQQIEPDTLSCSDITSPTTLVDRGEGIDYLVPCYIDVYEHLSIEAGVTIAFEQGAGFKFSNYSSRTGSLTALGEEGDSIRFTGALGIPGSWEGIDFDTDDIRNEMSYCIIEMGGGSAGDRYAFNAQNDALLAMSHCLIQDNKGSGMRVHRSAQLSEFKANSFRYNDGYPIGLAANKVTHLGQTTTYKGNAISEVFVNSGSIYDRGFLEGQDPHVWEDQGIPYFVDETLLIGERDFGHLIIEEGAVLSFSEKMSISVNEHAAVLEVNGTANNPVSLEGRNGIGSWNGVWVETNATQNRITHATITDAGQEAIGHWFSDGAALSLGYSTSTTQIKLEDVNLANSAGCGIAESGSVTINATNLQFNNIAGGNYCN